MTTSTSTDAKQKPVFAEISEDGKSIEVYFKPTPKLLDKMHQIDARFMSRERLDKAGLDGEPHWRIPTDYWAAQDLTKLIGKDNLELGDLLKSWAWEKKEDQDKVGEILGREGKAELLNLKKKLPKLYEAIWVGPKGKSMTKSEFVAALKAPSSYQATDVEFMAYVKGALNANQPGTGKTLELIASVYEAGLENGAHLVVAPVTSLADVWERELNRWQDMPVYRAAGEGMKPRDRVAEMRNAELAIELGRPFWLLVNPEMVRLKKRNAEQGAVKENLYADWPFLADTDWTTVTLDECHKNAIRNLTTVTARGIMRLEGEKKTCLSGTPVGGKVINLFGPLHWMHTQEFPSRNKWGQQWLEVEEVHHSKNETHIEIGDVREDRAAEFDAMMKPIMIRRTKAEVLPWLPEKDYIPVWCGMTDAQSEQYMKFAKMAEVELGDQTLTATNVLSIYTRLKQFASATQRFEDGNLIPTEDSGKVHALLEKLEELGILDGDGDAQTVIGSQFTGMINMLYDYLTAKGVPCARITGQTAKRADAIKSFQEDKTTRVMLINTDAGGVSITLDAADTIHILDEKWNPDSQEQLEDRIHRGSRIHQVTCYYYRTTGTIEEYIKQVTDSKGLVNKKVLDERRLRLY